MKEIMAIIRMDKINQTKKALVEAGFPALTCRKVFGRGKKKVDYELIQQLIAGEEIQSPKTAEVVSEGHRLVPKRLITLMVNDEDVKAAVQTIIDINQTASPGDGKIFVIPIEEAIRVRTGETGVEAL